MNITTYNELIPAEWFYEYKNSNDENIKKEIQKRIFDIIRSVNEFPEKELDLNKEMQNLRTLSNINIRSMYVDNRISINSVGQSLCYQFYPNIWDVKKSRKGIRPISMRESFLIDKDLNRAIKMNLTYDTDISGLRSWFRMSDIGYCMNFRPATAKVVYDYNLQPKSKVLDYAAGYGGRLLGAWAAENIDEYIGIEPNTETFNNGNKFIEFLNSKYINLSKACLYKVCSEDFTVKKYPQYREYFDMAFSSPPYFDLEIYSNEKTQSYNKFPNYSMWVKNYLRPTIHNCIDMLKPKGRFAINIYEDSSEYNKAPNIKKIIQFICYERKFKLYKEDFMILTKRAGNGSRDRNKEKTEPIWYFRKD